MKRRTVETIALLERAAGAALAGAYARAAAVERQRRRVLERSLSARRSLAVRPVWTAFSCTSLCNHIAANASEASALLEHRYALLDAGKRWAKEKARWAAARAGLMRRAVRTQPATRRQSTSAEWR